LSAVDKVAGQPAGTAPARPRSPFSRFVSDFAESRIAVGAFCVMLVIIFVAAAAPWVSPINPYDLSQLSILDNLLPPGSQGMNGMTFLLGTDGQGRDLLSAIFYGLRTSIFVGLASGLLALLLGMTLGLIAAYVGGGVDSFIMRLVDLQLSFPSILVALLLLAALGQGVDKIIIALVIVQWAYYARTVRGSALVERAKEYMEAAACLKLGHVRILFGHLLPNCLPPLIVVGSVQVAYAIALEATLSFLGLGLPRTEPSLGLLIANGSEYIMSGRYWISFFPGIALVLTIASINLVSDQVRDLLNPRLRT
jgi:peptide/nickel transport system permease protein